MKIIKNLLCLAVLGLWQPVPAQTEITRQITPPDSLTLISVPADTASIVAPTFAWQQKVQTRLEQLLQSKLLETSQLGLAVYDLTADSVLYKYQERQHLRPASTMKLITAITALDQLGGDYELKTELYYTGSIENRTLKGDIYCVGGFDPLFDKEDMQAFATCVQELGIDTIRGTLYADKGMKDLNLLGEGWCWDDDNPVLSPLLYRRKDHFMAELERRLRESGIQVEAFSTTGSCPANAQRLCLRTHTIDQVLLPMVKKSDNLCAEALFYQLPGGERQQRRTAKDASNVVKRLIKKVGLNPSTYKIADGSGLSLYNYLSAELLIEFLKYAHRQPRIYNHLLPTLPVAGVDGTLSDRMRDANTRGKVWAKTGTVTGVSSLAGYCQAPNGHLLCFAIINQGVMHGKNAHRFQDKVCEALCLP